MAEVCSSLPPAGQPQQGPCLPSHTAMVTATLTLPAVTSNGVANGVAIGVANGTAKAAGPPGRKYITYDAIHSSIASSVGMLEEAGWSTPDYLVAISGGGVPGGKHVCMWTVTRGTGRPGPCIGMAVAGVMGRQGAATCWGLGCGDAANWKAQLPAAICCSGTHTWYRHAMHAEACFNPGLAQAASFRRVS